MPSFYPPGLDSILLLCKFSFWNTTFANQPGVSKKKKGIHCLKYQYKSRDLASLPRSTHRSTCCILLKQPVYSRLVPFKQFNLRIFPRVRHVKICVNFFFTLVIRELYVFFFQHLSLVRLGYYDESISSIGGQAIKRDFKRI